MKTNLEPVPHIYTVSNARIQMKATTQLIGFQCLVQTRELHSNGDNAMYFTMVVR